LRCRVSCMPAHGGNTMIGSPLALTIRRKIKRPPAALLDQFRNVPTCFIADACAGRGTLHHSIKPLDPSMCFCGTAVTAHGGPMDNLAAMAILDFVSPGDVIMIASGGNDAAAVIGDLWALSAKWLGVAGVVCDGLVRDMTGLLAADIPLFARGWCPNAGYRNGPGEINLGVVCGGVPVDPGDIVVGDRDGVVVVPLNNAGTVLDQLALVRQKEDNAQAKLRRGEALTFWDEASLSGRGGVRYLD
jgi:4-hydroxy-4-methyl-2-oxoglutarate aldolase